MFDQIRFFTRSYTHEPVAVADSSGVGNDIALHPPEDAMNYDPDTYWENDAATPQFDIDLGAAYSIDSLWLKHFNVDIYALYYSTDDIVYAQVSLGTDGESGGLIYKFTFIAQTARYWRIIVTGKAGPGNVRFYDVMLMDQRLLLYTETDYPAMMDVITSDKSGGNYVMSSGALSSFSGERKFVNINMQFEFLPKTRRDELYDLFAAPDCRMPMTIYPDEGEYPDDIYRVLWKDKVFPLKYQWSNKLSGFQGTLKFQEY